MLYRCVTLLLLEILIWLRNIARARIEKLKPYAAVTSGGKLMKKLLIIFAILACALFISTRAGLAYTIDGDVDDWGVDLSATGAANAGYLDSNLPSGGNDIDHEREDNADFTSSSIYVEPGYSIYNRYDAEAMYFDNDADHGYIAIVTGLPPGETLFPPGDIANPR